jgi:hypothetical protein
MREATEDGRFDCVPQASAVMFESVAHTSDVAEHGAPYLWSTASADATWRFCFNFTARSLPQVQTKSSKQ